MDAMNARFRSFSDSVSTMLTFSSTNAATTGSEADDEGGGEEMQSTIEFAEKSGPDECGEAAAVSATLEAADAADATSATAADAHASHGFWLRDTYLDVMQSVAIAPVNFAIGAKDAGVRLASSTASIFSRESTTEANDVKADEKKASNSPLKMEIDKTAPSPPQPAASPAAETATAQERPPPPPPNAHNDRDLLLHLDALNERANRRDQVFHESLALSAHVKDTLDAFVTYLLRLTENGSGDSSQRVRMRFVLHNDGNYSHRIMESEDKSSALDLLADNEEHNSSTVSRGNVQAESNASSPSNAQASNDREKQPVVRMNAANDVEKQLIEFITTLATMLCEDRQFTKVWNAKKLHILYDGDAKRAREAAAAADNGIEGNDAALSGAVSAASHTPNAINVHAVVDAIENDITLRAFPQLFQFILRKRKAEGHLSPERFGARVRRLAALVTHDTLEIAATSVDDNVLDGIARDCLLAMCMASPPSAKLRALVTLCDALVSDSGAADLLLPLLVLLILRVNPDYVNEHTAFINLRNPALLRGIECYCFISFSSALAFIEQCDERSLKIDASHFLAEMKKHDKQALDEWRAL